MDKNDITCRIAYFETTDYDDLALTKEFGEFNMDDFHSVLGLISNDTHITMVWDYIASEWYVRLERYYIGTHYATGRGKSTSLSRALLVGLIHLNRHYKELEETVDTEMDFSIAEGLFDE